VWQPAFSIWCRRDQVLAWPHDATVMESFSKGEFWQHVGHQGSAIRHMPAEGELLDVLRWFGGEARVDPYSVADVAVLSRDSDSLGVRALTTSAAEQSTFEAFCLRF